MTTFIEGELRVTFTDAVSARKFDGDSHRLSHCMKAVDFIVELPDCYLFIEFKDAQDSTAPQRAMDTYLERFLKGSVDKDLIYKYRDSLLYERAAGRGEKPIKYLVLIASDALEAAHLLSRQEALNRKLPLRGPGGQSWVRPIVKSCAVLNIDTWNKYLPHYLVARILA